MPKKFVISLQRKRSEQGRQRPQRKVMTIKPEGATFPFGPLFNGSSSVSVDYSGSDPPF